MLSAGCRSWKQWPWFDWKHRTCKVFSLLVSMTGSLDISSHWATGLADFRILECIPIKYVRGFAMSCWRHQIETFSPLLAICAGNSPVTGEFPAQRPVTHSFGVFFDLRLNKQLSKQSWGWWFETPLRPLWRHSNVLCWCSYIIGSCWFL